jgi:hypothetical protein
MAKGVLKVVACLPSTPVPPSLKRSESPENDKVVNVTNSIKSQPFISVKFCVIKQK